MYIIILYTILYTYTAMDFIKTPICSDLIKLFDQDSLTAILQKIYSVLGVVLKSEHSKIRNKMIELDLDVKLKEIDGLLKDISKNTVLADKECINICVLALHDAINKVHNILNIVQVRIDDHSNKWFGVLRSSIELDQEILDLTAYEYLLNIRYNRLKDLLKINWASKY